MLACALFHNHAQMKKAGYVKALRPDFDEKFELVESHEVYCKFGSACCLQ